MNKGHRESYKKYAPNYAPKFAASSLTMLMNLSAVPITIRVQHYHRSED
jgi:hypothetical protein